VTLTNRNEQVTECRFTESSLSLVGEAGDPPPQWIVAAATNLDTGQKLKFFMDGQWSGITGGPQSKNWPLDEMPTKVIVQFADPKTFTAAWYVDPSVAPRSPASLGPFMQLPPPFPPPIFSLADKRHMLINMADSVCPFTEPTRCREHGSHLSNPLCSSKLS
jgi:hypothetical protein